MLLISRESLVRLGKHAWHVYPLEAFGYLLGKGNERLSAALPCAKTSRWDEFADRWTGIEQHYSKARAVADKFDLEVLGFYASTQSIDGYPKPLFSITSEPLILLYSTQCCRGCSGFNLDSGERRLTIKEDYLIAPGKRLDLTLNQDKVLKEWRRVFGPIDYSNGYLREIEEPGRNYYPKPNP
jgi:hypothetical protein